MKIAGNFGVSESDGGVWGTVRAGQSAGVNESDRDFTGYQRGYFSRSADHDIL